jgi:hypothetical protein
VGENSAGLACGKLSMPEVVVKKRLTRKNFFDLLLDLAGLGK